MCVCLCLGLLVSWPHARMSGSPRPHSVHGALSNHCASIEPARHPWWSVPILGLHNTPSVLESINLTILNEHHKSRHPHTPKSPVIMEYSAEM